MQSAVGRHAMTKDVMSRRRVPVEPVSVDATPDLHHNSFIIKGIAYAYFLWEYLP